MALIDQFHDDIYDELPDWLISLHRQGLDEAHISSAIEIENQAGTDAKNILTMGAEKWNIWASYLLIDENPETQFHLYESIEFPINRDDSKLLLSGLVVPRALRINPQSDIQIENSIFLEGLSFFGKGQPEINLSYCKVRRHLAFSETSALNRTDIHKTKIWGSLLLSGLSHRHSCLALRSSSVSKSIRISDFDGIRHFGIDSKSYVNTLHIKSEQDNPANIIDLNLSYCSLGNVDFEHLKFTDKAKFHKTNISGNVTIYDCLFEEALDFDKSHITEGIVLRHSIFKNVVDFSQTKFSENAIFSKAEFLHILSLTGAQFKKRLPDFDATDFRQPPRLSDIEFPAPWQLEEKDSAHKYRRLKELAATAHDHHTEGRLFRYELLAKRGTEVTGYWGKLGISAYEWSSRCGQNFGRAMELWLWSVIVFTIAYVTVANTGQETSLRYYQALEVGLFSLLNSLPLLGTGLAKQSPALLNTLDYQAAQNWMVTVLLLMQNVISTIFLFLAGLGLRNFFKLR